MSLCLSSLLRDLSRSRFMSAGDHDPDLDLWRFLWGGRSYPGDVLAHSFYGGAELSLILSLFRTTRGRRMDWLLLLDDCSVDKTCSKGLARTILTSSLSGGLSHSSDDSSECKFTSLVLGRLGLSLLSENAQFWGADFNWSWYSSSNPSLIFHTQSWASSLTTLSLKAVSPLIIWILGSRLSSWSFGSPPSKFLRTIFLLSLMILSATLSEFSLKNWASLWFIVLDN